MEEQTSQATQGSEDIAKKASKPRKPRNSKPDGEQAPRRRNTNKKPQEDKATQIADNVVYGRNSVLEAIKVNRSIDKILVQSGEMEGSIKKIIGDAKKKGLLVQEVDKAKLDTLANFEKHQGVIAFVAAHKYYTIEEMLNDAKAKNQDPFLVILENIQDPHNLGAIIRTAHNAGAHGVIIPKHRAVGLTPIVAKSSAGALEYMKVAKVTNISQTIEKLKAQGIWVACADMDGEAIFKENLRGPIGIVVGNEGEGISKNVKNKCDFVISIPMYGKISSLNASVATAVLCYEVVRQRNY